MNDLIPKKYRKDEELIRLTIEQLKKDFGSHLPALQFSGRKEFLFAELREQVASFLSQIKKSNHALFQSILYRVDVPERDAAAVIDQKDCIILAEIIIQREFKKVIIRRFLSF